MRDQYKVLAEKYDQVQESQLPVVMRDGSKKWMVNGILHRLDGPAIVCVDGTKAWLVNGKHHRLDGPAIERADGAKQWYVNGKRHRLDGPAIEHADGAKQWFIDGEEMSEDEFNIILQRRDILKKASDKTGIEMDI